MSRPIGSRKSVPSYCHHKASGQAYATISGVERYFGAYNSPESRTAYDRAVAEWLSGGRLLVAPGKSTPVSPTTVATVLAAFWEHAKQEYPAEPREPGKRPAGELGNYFDAIKIVRRFYGDTAAANFGPRALRALVSEMIQLDQSRKYINRQCGRIKAIFKWAVANEMIEPAIYQRLCAVGGLKRGRSSARESDPVKPVADHVIDATLPHLSRHVRAMVEIQLLTGARPGEICSMRSRDIDTTGKVWVYRPTEHKTQHHGHDREIRFGPKAQAILRPFLKADLAAYVFSPAEAEAERLAAKHAARKTPLSCGNRPGKNRKRRRERKPSDHYIVSSYRRAIARACDNADDSAREGTTGDERIIPRWHPHQLRHNAATRLRRDYGVDAAAVILGHATLRATQIYAEMDGAKAESIMAEVG